jgi:hypothetical protein
MKIEVHHLRNNPTAAWNELSKIQKVIKVQVSPPNSYVADNNRVVSVAFNITELFVDWKCICIQTSICIMQFREVHVKWVHCLHGMVRPWVADREDGLQIWRVAVNILNKQSRTADSGWSSSLGANNTTP